ncbi:hypothetical protein BT63DRAFT_28801 [Microthyrium microscopicum]|uniref:Uncharacterized protein n=1 Tax=Microthyrium microscopicum TaxID=703497 RepID=A0A6A6UTH3_9PEZI|nr:hypothetical protein BT63DRAFT_28801 [Microthyrium microscopicum]
MPLIKSKKHDSKSMGTKKSEKDLKNHHDVPVTSAEPVEAGSRTDPASEPFSPERQETEPMTESSKERADEDLEEKPELVPKDPARDSSHAPIDRTSFGLGPRTGTGQSSIINEQVNLEHDHQQLLALHQQALDEKRGQEDLVEHYKNQYQQQVERNKQLEQSWKKATNELRKFRQQGPVHKVDDDFLKGLWTSIRYDCRNWASTYCLGGQRVVVTEEKVTKLFSAFTPEFMKYLRSARLRSSLIESFLIHELLFKVLTRTLGPGLLWAGRHGQALKSLQTYLEPARDIIDTPSLLVDKTLKPADVQEYHAWRAKTAMLLSEKVSAESVSQRIKEVVNSLSDDLGDFVVNKKPTHKDDLTSIVKKAVELDQEIQKSKAIFAFQSLYNPKSGESYGFYFNTQLMESESSYGEATTDMIVELVVAPCFHKIGTGDGQGYDQTSMLAKASVVCAESRKKAERMQ